MSGTEGGSVRMAVSGLSHQEEISAPGAVGCFREASAVTADPLVAAAAVCCRHLASAASPAAVTGKPAAAADAAAVAVAAG